MSVRRDETSSWSKSQIFFSYSQRWKYIVQKDPCRLAATIGGNAGQCRYIEGNWKIIPNSVMQWSRWCKVWKCTCRPLFQDNRVFFIAPSASLDIAWICYKALSFCDFLRLNAKKKNEYLFKCWSRVQVFDSIFHYNTRNAHLYSHVKCFKMKSMINLKYKFWNSFPQGHRLNDKSEWFSNIVTGQQSSNICSKMGRFLISL